MRRRPLYKAYSSEDDEYWSKLGFQALNHIDKNTHCIPQHNTTRFLELGCVSLFTYSFLKWCSCFQSCCPGGFAHYILRRNPNAQGVGVSLDPEMGGSGLTIPFPELERFKMHWSDLTYLAICAPGIPPLPPGGVALSPLPFDPTGFRVVILDGMYRNPPQELNSHPWDMDRLLIAQLIIGLECLDGGGTLLVKFNHLESVVTAQLVYMLDVLSKRVIAFKPFLHATRGSFYAVATGVGLERKNYLKNLKTVWWNLTYDGPKGEGRYLKEEDLNFIVEFETLEESYLERLIELGRGAWRAQSKALRRTYKRIRARHEFEFDNHDILM